MDNKYTVGTNVLNEKEFYELMVRIFLKQRKNVVESYLNQNYSGVAAQVRICALNQPSDVLWMFNEAMFDFFTSDYEYKPNTFVNELSAFGYIFGCFKRVKKQYIGYSAAFSRTGIKNDQKPKDFFNKDYFISVQSLKNYNYSENFVLFDRKNGYEIICDFIKSIRNNEKYDKYQKRAICKIILMLLQKRKFIEYKKSRPTRRDLKKRELKMFTVAESELKSFLFDRMNKRNSPFNLKLLLEDKVAC